MMTEVEAKGLKAGGTIRSLILQHYPGEAREVPVGSVLTLADPPVEIDLSNRRTFVRILVDDKVYLSFPGNYESMGSPTTEACRCDLLVGGCTCEAGRRELAKERAR